MLWECFVEHLAPPQVTVSPFSEHVQTPAGPACLIKTTIIMDDAELQPDWQNC